ncbi:hypothetical protein LSAT2_026047 [Lamellibrachia satsuma]|nr:hypothetical protein LSAT2_026047 [Lamellibrachia satsuma]
MRTRPSGQAIYMAKVHVHKYHRAYSTPGSGEIHSCLRPGDRSTVSISLLRDYCLSVSSTYRCTGRPCMNSTTCASAQPRSVICTCVDWLPLRKQAEIGLIENNNCGHHDRYRHHDRCRPHKRGGQQEGGGPQKKRGPHDR